jgi:hypothetical protein
VKHCAVVAAFSLGLGLVLVPSSSQAVVTTLANAGTVDSDGDGVFDIFDNAPGTSNVSQIDTDNDGIGDAIDPTPFASNPNLGDPGLLLGAPSIIPVGSSASVPYLVVTPPPESFGRVELDLGGDGTYDAVSFGPLTGSLNNIVIPASLFTSALWDLNTPGTYTLHAKALAAGRSSDNVSITNVTVVVPEPASLGLVLAPALPAMNRRRRSN